LANVVLCSRAFGSKCCVRIDIGTAIHWLARKESDVIQKITKDLRLLFRPIISPRKADTQPEPELGGVSTRPSKTEYDATAPNFEA
jgi:hypothetical protein